MMFCKHPIDCLTFVLIAWCFLYLSVNIFVPDRWVLDYQELTVSDVCRDEVQSIYGKRVALFTMDGSGVDKLISVDLDRPVDRLEWSGQYQGGMTEGTWKHLITEPAGTYYWEATTLKVNLPLFLSKYINDVRSNTFEVYECT